MATDQQTAGGPLRIGIIGGTGIGQALGANGGRRHEVDTPFGKPSDTVVETEWAGVPVFLLSRHGPGHRFNPSQVPYRANVFALKQLGCTHVIASGAVGSLREEFKPRHLVVPDQVIDKTHKRPNTFYEGAAVHVEFAEPFCPVLRRTLLDAAKETSGEVGSGDVGSEQSTPPTSLTVHDRGCYVCMEGPAFSTRAESLMHRLWGGDLIGMTALPEARLAREAELSYALVALVTDYDCWRQHPQSQAVDAKKLDPHVLLEEIVGNLKAATANAMTLIRRAIELMPARAEELLAAPAQRSLRLGIWSDKAAIDPAEVARLRPLWGRYFEPEPSAAAASEPAAAREPTVPEAAEEVSTAPEPSEPQQPEAQADPNEPEQANPEPTEPSHEPSQQS